MKPAELRRIIKAAKLANMSEAARKIGVARSHLYRWLNGETVIDEASALLIRAKLPPKTNTQ